MSFNVVDFPSALILEINYRTSKAGNQWCNLSFLDSQHSKVYSIPVFGEAVGLLLGCSEGSCKRLLFDVTPDRNGGVRLVLSGLGESQVGGEYM